MAYVPSNTSSRTVPLSQCSEFRLQYVVMRNAISTEDAAKYADKAQEWLEGFNMGYKRDDPATWKKDNIPKQWK